MKNILLILVCVISLQSYSQTKTEILSKKKIHFILNCENRMEVNLSTSDTTYKIVCSFQNQKYQHITDIGIYSVYRKEKLDETISNLKECVKYMDDKSISFSIGSFVIYDFSKNLYINDSDGEYTTLSKKGVLKWIKWLEGCVMK